MHIFIREIPIIYIKFSNIMKIINYDWDAKLDIQLIKY